MSPHIIEKISPQLAAGFFIAVKGTIAASIARAATPIAVELFHGMLSTT